MYKFAVLVLGKTSLSETSFSGRRASVVGTAVDVVVGAAVVGVGAAVVGAAVVGAAVVGTAADGVGGAAVLVTSGGVEVPVVVAGAAGVVGNSQMAETASGSTLYPAAEVLRKHCFQA